MQIFLNGRFVPEKRAVVSVFDRGFLYGDGLFETVLVSNGQPFRLAAHLQRFERGIYYLAMPTPLAKQHPRHIAEELIRRNKMPDALLRISVSRGVGLRGYSPKGAEKPTFVMSLHPLPPTGKKSWKLVTTGWTLQTGQFLSYFKHSSRLMQVMARMEADEKKADEALFINSAGFVAEGTSGNLFWVKRNTVCTPPATAGILPGVTRSIVLEICKLLAIKTSEVNATLDQLKRMDGVFLSLTSRGVVAAQSLDGKRLKQSPLVKRIATAYHQIVQEETATR